MCSVSKPIVNGIKHDVQGRADVVFLDLLSDVGRQAARLYGVKVVPALLVFDGQGTIVYRQSGLPDAGAVKAAVAAYAEDDEVTAFAAIPRYMQGKIPGAMSSRFFTPRIVGPPCNACSACRNVVR